MNYEIPLNKLISVAYKQYHKKNNCKLYAWQYNICISISEILESISSKMLHVTKTIQNLSNKLQR